MRIFENHGKRHARHTLYPKARMLDNLHLVPKRRKSKPFSSRHSFINFHSLGRTAVQEKDVWIFTHYHSLLPNRLFIIRPGHYCYQFLESRFRLPAELFLYLSRVAEQDINLGRAEIPGVDFYDLRAP